MSKIQLPFKIMIYRFYCGKAFVCLKDKVTQPSSALRHARELSQLLQSPAFGNVTTSTSILLSGGPDHRITYISVQLSLLWL